MGATVRWRPPRRARTTRRSGGAVSWRAPPGRAGAGSGTIHRAIRFLTRFASFTEPEFSGEMRRIEDFPCSHAFIAGASATSAFHDDAHSIHHHGAGVSAPSTTGASE